MGCGSQRTHLGTMKAALRPSTPSPQCSRRSGSLTAQLAHLAEVRLREGFRMPARDDLSAVVRAGVRKPPRKEPAGRWWAVCRLWGFDRAAVSAGAGLGGVVKGGPPSIIEN